MLGFVFIAGPRADSCAWPLVASRVCRPFVFHVEYLSRVCFAEKPPGNVLTFPRLPAPISVRVPPPPPPPPVPTLDPRTHAQGDVQRDNRVHGILLRDDRFYVSNCGDSRAVLARRGAMMKKKTETTKTSTDDDGRCTTNENCRGSSDRRDRHINGLIVIPLLTDQNQDSLGEKERILSSGGYVTPPPEPGLSTHVWLDRGHIQIGLAMSRSIGDHTVKDVGVIARPVVTTRVIDWASDDFVIVVTDRVWEFLSSEDAIIIVGRHLYGETADDDNNDGKSRGHNDDYDERDEACSGGIGGGGGGASAACKALIKAASEKWHEHEGDYRDDITVILFN